MPTSQFFSYYLQFSRFPHSRWLFSNPERVVNVSFDYLTTGHRLHALIYVRLVNLMSNTIAAYTDCGDTVQPLSAIRWGSALLRCGSLFISATLAPILIRCAASSTGIHYSPSAKKDTPDHPITSGLVFTSPTTLSLIAETRFRCDLIKPKLSGTYWTD